MAKAASSEELRAGFEEHLEQTKGHLQPLKQIFEMLDENPKGKKCRGMEGLVEEGSEIMGEDFEDALLHAALIGAAQRVEHYEIAAYRTVRAFAEELGAQLFEFRAVYVFDRLSRDLRSSLCAPDGSRQCHSRKFPR